MKKIKVFIYSYKNKNLLEFCEDLKKKSFNDITIDVYDQNTVNRLNSFKNKPNINYKHVHWDDRKGIPYYRLMSLYGKYDYFLSISDLIIFKPNWDLDLINECDNKNIISGKGLVSLNMETFFVVSNLKTSKLVTQSQWINEDFIFLKMSQALLLSKSKFLKKYGESLFFSILFTELNIDIKSMNNSFYNKVVEKEKYLPYSKYHGYNKLIDMIKNKEIKSKAFEKYHGINLSNLKTLPFETDDVSYNTAYYSIDFEDSTRFHSGLKRIDIK
jgi:hypothetical protein